MNRPAYFNFHKPIWTFYEPAPTPEQIRHREAMVAADGLVQGSRNRPLDTTTPTRYCTVEDHKPKGEQKHD